MILREFRAERTIPLLTQAWLKFYEILVEFPSLTAHASERLVSSVFNGIIMYTMIDI